MSLLTCYEMDPDFVGVVPGQGGQALVPVALGQPDHLLPAKAELVGAQVVAVKDVHHAVRCQHGEADPEEQLSHLPWRPVNLDVSVQRQFHLPPALFTCLMKNWGVPEIIAREFLHICQNFRGICKSIKNDIF